MSRKFSKISIHSHVEEEPVEVIPIFPKQLPEVKVGPVYDESGFTLNERLALKQAWKLIKPFERRYGKEIYFSFLMENYKAFEYFRRAGKLNLHLLHGHSLSFMRFIGAIIEQNDPVVFQAMLTDNNNTHNRCQVSHQFMEILIKALISYVLEKLKFVCSASLESGFQRLLEKFQAFSEIDGKGPSFTAFSRNISKRSFSINSLDQTAINI